MDFLSTDSLRAWASARSIGRSLAFPDSPDLAFRTNEATWYRFRVATQPSREELSATIVTTAAAGHGGFLFPPYRDGRWTDPLDQSWRGRPLVTGWHDRSCTGKFIASCRATQVMRRR